MTDAEIAIVIANLKKVSAYLASKTLPGRVVMVDAGVAALEGLLTDRTALTTEKTAWEAERLVLQQAASGQLYRDLAYGFKAILKSIDELPGMQTLVANVKALPPLPPA